MKPDPDLTTHTKILNELRTQITLLLKIPGIF